MDQESSNQSTDEELTKAVRVVKIASLVVFLIILLVVVTIGVSGFLPANKRSKMGLLSAVMRSIEIDIKEHISTSQAKLPASWTELYDRWDRTIPSYIRDPFQRSGNLNLRSEGNWVIVWSVGPDGEDDLQWKRDNVNRVDEIVLIIEYQNGEFSSKTLGLEEQ